MRRLNGVYTQAFNYRRKRPGHVFQGRYKSILVDKDNYLLELCRYIVLNPVRAGMVKSPEQWSWSSYPATAGLVKGQRWLATDQVLALFSGNRKQSCHFVMDGIGKGSVWEDLRGQIYLGDDSFLERMQDKIEGKSVSGIAIAQIRPKRPAADEIVKAVAEKYSINAGEVLDRGPRRCPRCPSRLGYQPGVCSAPIPASVTGQCRATPGFTRTGHPERSASYSRRML